MCFIDSLYMCTSLCVYYLLINFQKSAHFLKSVFNHETTIFLHFSNSVLNNRTVTAKYYKEIPFTFINEQNTITKINERKNYQNMR